MNAGSRGLNVFIVTDARHHHFGNLQILDGDLATFEEGGNRQAYYQPEEN
jgi:hypothetical protein